MLRADVRAFCFLDLGYFFGKPFVPLLVVSPDAGRRGLGTGLPALAPGTYPEVRTSTNPSNSAMRGLLDTMGWRCCDRLSGLDDGDDELFCRTP